MQSKRFTMLLALACFAPAGCLDESTGTVTSAASLSGAVYTSTVTGDQVDKNIYELKTDVYIDGGPPDGAPSGSGALPEGNYYFQVTDPPGKNLLSLDDITCREFHVNASGVIDAVVGPCSHATGIDTDHAELGAITIQLIPYDDTPNEGGEYKVWVTPVGEYVDPETPGSAFGFVSSESKTDNYKVTGGVVKECP